MRLQVALFVALAVLAVLQLQAALPLGKGTDETEEGEAPSVANKDLMNARRAWPCCDKCGLCLQMIPPMCTCMDLSAGGCHPACRKCLRFTTSDSAHEPPVYRCADLLTNFCRRRCTPKPAVA